MSRERRPKKDGSSMIFSRIHIDTLPHTTKTSRGCFLNIVSQAIFNVPGKRTSPDAIQDISSRSTTVRPSSRISRSRREKALVQFSGAESSTPVTRHNCSEKLANWSLVPIPSPGRKPSIRINRASDRSANTSIRVDFPILRLPRQVTNDDVRFFQSAIKSEICSLRP